MNLEALDLAKKANLIPLALGLNQDTGEIHLLAGSDIHKPSDYSLLNNQLVLGTTFESLSDGLSQFKRYDTEGLYALFR